MKLKDSYLIRIHSFVDLITNSSTEIYINADQNTIESIKEVIDNILKIGGSELKANDLFTFELEDDGYRSVKMIVKTKDEESELGKATARILSNLTGLFNIDGEYNG